MVSQPPRPPGIDCLVTGTGPPGCGMMIDMTQRKAKRTITLDAEVAGAAEAEAALSHAGNLSAWFNALARRETLAAVYRRAAEQEMREQAEPGRHTSEQLAARTDERLAMRADISGEDATSAA
jgi:hypothetical protein